ncbi:hypothetical protein LPB140_07205 [Sphingorhabdus lutea]|uniref:Uncharacterized protein n=1 Tax=Sphingorhabdus lutea TaxID=1913578 RepID=A0A1L3JBV1_9SPHN|nr:hypothetical protein [Sphingorhabdus lutea]APG62606.1 hypothetical protein LPB140_07205 [Sphingorhabdus lutea]
MSVTTALISVHNFMQDGPESLSALNSIFSKTVVEEQIDQLIRLKFKRIFISVGQITSKLTDIIDKYQSGSVEIILIRSAQDLKEKIENQSFLLVGDSIIMEDNIINVYCLANNAKNKLFLLDSREENADFERLDLNNRWAGFALLQGDMLSNISDVADDWSLESMLVRIAMQRSISHQQLPNNLITNGHIVIVKNKNDIKSLAEKKFSKLKNTASSGIIFNAVTFFWSKHFEHLLILRPVKLALQILPILFLLCALSLAYFSYAEMALLATSLAGIILANMRLMNKLSNDKIDERLYNISLIILLFLIYFLLFNNDLLNIYFAIFLSYMTIAAIFVCHIKKEGYYHYIDPILLNICSIICAYFGFLLPFMMVIIAFIFSNLIWDNVKKHK